MLNITFCDTPETVTCSRFSINSEANCDEFASEFLENHRHFIESLVILNRWQYTCPDNNMYVKG